MKMSEFLTKLRVLQVVTVYVIHKENPSFEEMFDIRRFEDTLREGGFIPLIADDYRIYGKAGVSAAISRSDFSIVLALDKDTENVAREQGVDFISIFEEGKGCIEDEESS